MRDLSQYTVEELQSYFSDFHKDYYGYRPRMILPVDVRTDREFLEDAINAIHNTMDAKKLTFAGREELRAAGWVVDEPEPEIIDPLEYAAWSDYLDAQAYGEMQ